MIAGTIIKPGAPGGRAGHRFGLIEHALAPWVDDDAPAREDVEQLVRDLAVVISASASRQRAFAAERSSWSDRSRRPLMTILPPRPAGDGTATILAFDVGKTGCRAGLFRGAQEVGRAEQSGSIGIADPGGVAAATAAMAAVAHQLGVPRVDVISAGLAGMAQAWDRAPQLSAALSLLIDTTQVVITGDMTTAHAGALGGHPGIVIAGGTGTVALALDTDGRFAVADGWGYLLGDDGSGYAIGRAGLNNALRHHDHRGGSAALDRLAQARFGPLDTLPATIHGAANPARAVASFAPDVLTAANDGDAVAVEIWAAAGRELAWTVAGAARLFGSNPFDVATTGGLFEAGPWLNRSFDTELTVRLPRARRRPAEGTAFDGARFLGTGQHPMYSTLVARYATSASAAPQRIP